ncbi:putative arad-like aldolase epimerase [Rosellinia necatrix]|uniref:Putative arad-like aldolase epimerase n=1 Tax=Rosellinia necatrix TaxID=77044 RepID=A0A1S7UHJ6_ROSNE|nr:putative arad-like aldolase epimerase [Rosellinia necatrix]
MVSANGTQLFALFINGLHILHNNGVLDAYGHLSVRNPDDTAAFFMSRSIAPALASSAGDIVEYRVSDASAVRADAPAGFIERYIHSEIYKRFPGVGAVVHSHSPALIPYGVSDVPLRPLLHLAGFLDDDLPVFDIAKYYHPNNTQDLLVRDARLGAALAAEFAGDEGEGEGEGDLPRHSVALMRNHGFTTCAADIEAAVVQAIYAQLNAQAQSQALAIQHAYSARPPPPLAYLTPRQARDGRATNLETVRRPWDLWVREVGVSPLYVNELAGR